MFVFFKITLRKIIMPIFIYKNNTYLLQNNQSFKCKYLSVQTIIHLFQNNTKQKIFGFQNTRLILPSVNFL